MDITPNSTQQQSTQQSASTSIALVGAGSPSSPVSQQSAPSVAIINEKGEFSENWKNILPDDLKNNPAIGSFKDLASMTKSYVNAQKMIGADKIALPGKYATPEERAEFFNRIGRPETPDKYELPKPQLPEGMSYSNEMEKSFRDLAHKTGLTAEQAKALHDWNTQNVLQSHAAREQMVAQQFQQAEDALKKEFGLAYEQKLAKANAVVRQFGAAELLEKKGFHNDPDVVRFLANIGEGMAEDKLIGKGDALTPSGAQSQINAIMGDTKGPYFDKNHPQHKETVAKVNALYTQIHN